MKLTLSQIEKLLEIFYNYLQSRGVQTITFSNEDDYYIEIPYDEIQDILKSKSCTNYIIGSLDEDIEGLKKLFLEAERTPTRIDIQRLGDVLKAIGALIEIKKFPKPEETKNQFITLDDLKKLSYEILKFTEWFGGTDTIEFTENQDRYLKVPYHDRTFIYDPERFKTAPYVAGSLSDDIKKLNEVLDGRKPTGTDLERLGAILRVLSYTLVINIK